MEEILKGKHILIADDDSRNIYALTCYLEAMGFGMRIHTAGSGKDVIGLLRRYEDIELILMDMMMPEMDGFEAIRRIRDDQATRNIPIIAVTAKAMVGDREKCLEAGASGYVSKPLDMDVLLHEMASLINPA
jgi:CheY-like chemotaxis protein